MLIFVISKEIMISFFLVLLSYETNYIDLDDPHPNENLLTIFLLVKNNIATNIIISSAPTKIELL